MENLSSGAMAYIAVAAISFFYSLIRFRRPLKGMPQGAVLVVLIGLSLILFSEAMAKCGLLPDLQSVDLLFDQDILLMTMLTLAASFFAVQNSNSVLLNPLLTSDLPTGGS